MIPETVVAFTSQNLARATVRIEFEERISSWFQNIILNNHDPNTIGKHPPQDAMLEQDSSIMIDHSGSFIDNQNKPNAMKSQHSATSKAPETPAVIKNQTEEQKVAIKANNITIPKGHENQAMVKNQKTEQNVATKTDHSTISKILQNQVAEKPQNIERFAAIKPTKPLLLVNNNKTIDEEQPKTSVDTEVTSNSSDVKWYALPRYFDQFPSYKQKHHNSIRKEFHQLAADMKWQTGEFRRQRESCLEMELRYWSRSRPPHRSGLQQLCADLGVGKVNPKTSDADCLRKLRGTLINLFDYIDCKRSGKPIEPIFHEMAEFKSYTQSSAKYFPRQVAKKVGPIKVMLEGVDKEVRSKRTYL